MEGIQVGRLSLEAAVYLRSRAPPFVHGSAVGSREQEAFLLGFVPLENSVSMGQTSSSRACIRMIVNREEDTHAHN